ncbi:hypothetical protein V2I01_26785 [Micromonospora sp. BRA006-A]|nr:hypothetical protein [Micromonospora sp. BRA006-A]
MILDDVTPRPGLHCETTTLGVLTRHAGLDLRADAVRPRRGSASSTGTPRAWMCRSSAGASRCA